MALKFQPAQVTPEQVALADFQYFCKYPLGINLWDCHKRWCDAVQAVVESDDYDGLLLLAPADHGKTSSVMIPAMLWLHARNQDSRIIFVSNKDEYAEQAGRAWARRISKSGVLKTKFQLHKGDKWSDSEYVLSRPNWESKDPSLNCLGCGSEIQGQRADFILCDDIATRRNSATVAGREKIQSWFFTDLGSRLDKGGKFIVASHRVNSEDIYSQLKNKERWLVIEDRAIIDDANEKILCPEQFTYKKLYDKRQDDPIGFELFYQQKAISQGLYVTRDQVEKVKDRSITFHHSLHENVRNQFWKITMSVDPAFSTSKHAKYSVIQIWGIDMAKNRTLLYALRDRLSPEHLIGVLSAKFRVYRPDLVFIEDNAAQSLIVPMLLKDFPLDRDKFKGLTTTSPDGRLDNEIGAMLKLFHLEKCPLKLPYGCQTSQAFADFFSEEVINYPNFRYSDCLMSWYLNEKGMGLIEHEKRTSYIAPHGIIGSVSNAVWRNHGNRM